MKPLKLLFLLILFTDALGCKEQVGKSAPTGSNRNGLSQKRLSTTMIENLALIKEELSPLAELANFSVQLLRRRTADRAVILKLNRDITKEAFSQYYGAKLHFQPRSQEELRNFIRNCLAGY